MKPIHLFNAVLVLLLLTGCKMGRNQQPKPVDQIPPTIAASTNTAAPEVTSGPVATEYVTPNTYEVEVFDDYTVTWQDGSRSFKILIRYPVGAPDPLPLIIFSHGGDTNNDGHHSYEEWGNALAGAGYAVIHIAHVEDAFISHCAPLKIPANECEGGDFTMKISNTGTLTSVWYNRPLDASAVLDDLANIERAANLQFDRERIGAAGHSGGTVTAMGLAGALRDFSPSVRGIAFADPRFKAFLATSPQGVGSIGYTETSWDKIPAPMLIATGSGDNTENDGARSRLDPFKYISAPDKYLLYIDSPEATHSVFGLGPDDSKELKVYIAASGIAFFDAYLRGLPEALAWLNSNGMEIWSDGIATITAK